MRSLPDLLCVVPILFQGHSIAKLKGFEYLVFRNGDLKLFSYTTQLQNRAWPGHHGYVTLTYTKFLLSIQNSIMTQLRPHSPPQNL